MMKRRKSRFLKVIATNITKTKGNEATKYIQNDIMTYWDEAAADKGL